MVAAYAAIRKRLCIISGGPGTGKTRTVVLLLALLLEQADNANLRIALAAQLERLRPVCRRRSKMPSRPAMLERNQDRLPEEASTIHRLLRSVPTRLTSAIMRQPSPNRCSHRDEASMVDLALMAKLVAAIPPSARLILLGDKDSWHPWRQGPVLADICNAGARRAFSKEFSGQFGEITGKSSRQRRLDRSVGPGDCIVELRKNYRFGENSGIYSLSQAVNDGDAERAIEVLRTTGRSPDSQIFMEAVAGTSNAQGGLKPMCSTISVHT